MSLIGDCSPKSFARGDDYRHAATDHVHKRLPRLCTSAPKKTTTTGTALIAAVDRTCACYTPIATIADADKQKSSVRFKVAGNTMMPTIFDDFVCEYDRVLDCLTN